MPMAFCLCLAATRNVANVAEMMSVNEADAEPAEWSFLSVISAPDRDRTSSNQLLGIGIATLMGTRLRSITCGGRVPGWSSLWVPAPLRTTEDGSRCHSEHDLDAPTANSPFFVPPE